MVTHRLLFVDDEPNVLKALTRIFRNENYEVHTAGSGHEALELLKENTFSLIISDYRMPELNGIEFLKLAKSKSPDTIRLLLTGFADMEVAVEAINEGEIYKLMEKPWDDNNLMIQVKRAIEHYELIIERAALLQKVQVQNNRLKDLNDNLEQIVIERTKEVQRAYAELNVKVRELQARDRINQRLLSISSFEETLEVILRELMGIKSFDRIVMYVADKDKKMLQPRVGLAKQGDDYVKIDIEKEKPPNLPAPKVSDGTDYPDTMESAAQSISEYADFLPIIKEKLCLGGIYMDTSTSRTRFSKQELKAIAGIGSMAAHAINEYLFTSSLPELGAEIEEMLRELK